MLSYRGFIFRRAISDLRGRYAGTALGVVWNIIHPLAMIVIYTMVFSAIMPVRLKGFSQWASYSLYLCSGLFPWMAFSDCVVRGCGAFVGNAAYLKKLPIPEYVFVAQAAVTSSLSLAINFILLLVVAVCFGLAPTWRWLLLPLPIVLLMALAYAFGLALASINVFFRDTAEITGIALQVAMWTAPIVYMRDILPVWAQSLMTLHPAIPALLMIRDLFLFSHLPGINVWVVAIGWPTLVFGAGVMILRALRGEIRDLI